MKFKAFLLFVFYQLSLAVEILISTEELIATGEIYSKTISDTIDIIQNYDEIKYNLLTNVKHEIVVTFQSKNLTFT